MKKIIKLNKQRTVNVESLMTLGKLSNNLIAVDITCLEDIEMEPFSGNFHVQGMRDGNLYLQEKPRRKRNESIFREDNSSLSLGRNGRYYFVFTMEEERLGELPSELIRQASAIAQKVVKRGFVNTKKEGGNE